MASIPRFYVYLLARPNGKVFYVGKGSKKRTFAHETEAKSGCRCHKCNVIRKIWRNGGEVHRHIVFTTDSEDEAFEYEREQISLYGRKNLCNHTDGGDGVRNLSDEARARISAAMKRRYAAGWIPPQPDQEARARGGMKRRGLKQSVESVAKRTAKRLGQKMKVTPEDSQRRAEHIKRVGKPFQKGVSAWNKGVPRSEATKRKLSESSAQASGLQYDITSPDGASYNTRNLKAFCREHGLNYDSIFHNLKHDRPYKGWILVKRARDNLGLPYE